MIVKFGFSCLYDNQKEIEVLYIFDKQEDIKYNELLADIKTGAEPCIVN